MADEIKPGAGDNTNAQGGNQNQNGDAAKGGANDNKQKEGATLLEGAPDDAAGKAAAEKAAADQKAAAEAKAAETATLQKTLDDAKKALEANPKDEKLKAAVKEAEDKLKAAGENKDGKEVVPEKYEFKAPEGMELDPELTDEFSKVAKELELSQEKAQKLADFGPKILQKAAEKQVQQWTEIREGWVNDLKADKEFGGPKLNETVERAKRALNKFDGGDGKLLKLLSAPNKGGTGFGDNDALIKFLARVDKATSEDSAIDGGDSGKDNRSAADVLYPNQGKQ